MRPKERVSSIADRASGVLDNFKGALLTNPYQGAMASLYVEGQILELIVELLNCISEEDVAPPESLPADQQSAWAAREILQSNLADPPTIRDLAQQVGLSYRRFTEVFRAVFGTGPYQCITEWRLDRAKQLLESGDLSVKQIAHMMGYSHTSSFSHAYRRRFGSPPSRHGAD